MSPRSLEPHCIPYQRYLASTQSTRHRMNIEIALQSIPKLSIRQDSLSDQLIDLIRVANKLGMYDAADFIANKIGTDPKVFEKK